MRMHPSRTIPHLCVIVPTGGNPTGCEATLRTLESLSAGVRIHVLLYDNTQAEDYRAVRKILRKNSWVHYRAPQKLPDAEFYQWVYSTASKSHPAEIYIQLEEGQIPHPHLLASAAPTWAAGDKEGILSLVGEEARPEEGPPESPEGMIPSDTVHKNFIVDKEGLTVLAQWSLTQGPLAKAFLKQKLPINRLRRSMINAILHKVHPTRIIRPPRKSRRRVAPLAQPLAQPAPTKTKTKRAAFLVATHHRPKLLKLCLDSLVAQRLPPTWEVEILVGGEPSDAGARVVTDYKGIRYVPVRSSIVTDKLNACLQATAAELILAADDDDIQPVNRLEKAISLHTDGADWSGTGLLYFYDVGTGKVMEWHGEAQKGLVGTSMSFRGSVIRKAGGWPSQRRGKDGPMARRIRSQKPTPRFKPLPRDLGPTLCIQHGNNLWRRPVIEEGRRSTRGGFIIRGLGPADDLDFIPHNVRKALRNLRTEG